MKRLRIVALCGLVVLAAAVPLIWMKYTRWTTARREYDFALGYSAIVKSIDLKLLDKGTGSKSIGDYLADELRNSAEPPRTYAGKGTEFRFNPDLNAYKGALADQGGDVAVVVARKRPTGSTAFAIFADAEYRTIQWDGSFENWFVPARS